MRHSRRKDKNRREISSEATTLLEFIKSAILLPYNFLMYMSGKKSFSHVRRPLDVMISFFTEAKFTVTIISINVAMFIISQFFPSRWISVLGISPVNMLEGRFYTLITAGFLHADITHLIGNMTFLFIFGRVVERKLGSSKTGMIYFGALVISGIFSNLIFLAMGKNVLGIGASGALMGLVSAGMLLDPFYITFFLFFPVPIMVVGWMALYSDIMGILTPIETNIGHAAHLGGFFSISLLMYMLKEEERNDLKRGLYINIFSFFMAFILLTIFRTFIR